MQQDATRPRPRLADESGATIVLMAVSIATLIACAAIAIDLGMLLNSRSEAQRTADAAALAGASVFLPPAVSDKDADVIKEARKRAKDYAAKNPVYGQAVALADKDISVLTDEGKVIVTVRREKIPLWFARIFGVTESAVGARAAAKAIDSGTVPCLKPFFIPDAWHEKSDPPNKVFDAGTDYYEAGKTSYGTEYRDVGGPDQQGEYSKDVGRLITLKAGHPGAAPQPGWFFPFSLTGNGASNYRDDIGNRCSVKKLRVGDMVWKEQGNMVGPTMQGIDDLIAKDPNAKWDAGRIIQSAFGGGTGEGSPRVVRVPLYDPTIEIPNGKKQMTILTFGAMFIESITPCVADNGKKCTNDKDHENREVTARWLGVLGEPDACDATKTCRSNIQYLRLVPIE